ncbi:hypothetical protein KC19_VG148700, partial [Ceratodon purpureus]
MTGTQGGGFPISQTGVPQRSADVATPTDHIACVGNYGSPSLPCTIEKAGSASGVSHETRSIDNLGCDARTVPKSVVVGGRDVSLDIASKETEKTISPTGNEDIQNASVPCKSGSATAPTITASTPSAGRARMCVDGMNTSHNSTQIAFGSYDDDCLRVEKRPLPLP